MKRNPWTSLYGTFSAAGMGAGLAVYFFAGKPDGATFYLLGAAVLALWAIREEMRDAS